jgi:hypothetical protein
MAYAPFPRFRSDFEISRASWQRLTDPLGATQETLMLLDLFLTSILEPNGLAPPDPPTPPAATADPW